MDAVVLALSLVSVGAWAVVGGIAAVLLKQERDESKLQVLAA